MIIEAPLSVSVCVVTYNHENYIRECIQSILTQQGDFNLEIIVCDDKSTDRTPEILKELELAHPENIKLTLHTKNIGATRNYIFAHSMASGQYVAHIDGDDLMLEGKLSKQLNYLSANPDCAAVTHTLACIDRSGEALNKNWPPKAAGKKFNLTDIINHHPAFGHSSIMYRAGMIDSILHTTEPEIIDLNIYIEIAKIGYVGFIQETLGQYRVDVGVSSKINLYRLAIAALNTKLLTYTSESTLQRARARQYYIFAKKAFVDGDLSKFEELIELSEFSQSLGIMHKMLYLTRHHAPLLRRIYTTLKLMRPDWGK